MVKGTNLHIGSNFVPLIKTPIMKRDSVRFFFYALILGLYLYFMGWSQFKYEFNPTLWLDENHHQVWHKLALLYGAFVVVLFLVFFTRKTPKDKYEDLWKK